MRRRNYLLYFLALYSAATVIISCHWRNASWPRFDRRAHAEDQRSRTVGVFVYCTGPLGRHPGGKGSGVIIDSEHVLTAKHVVSVCGAGEIVAEIAVRLEDNTRIVAELDALGRGDYDVALLSGHFGRHTPLEIASVEVDDPICASVAIPLQLRGCGVVYHVEDDAVYTSFVADFGNSGSGVYDGSNRLIGLVVRLIPCGINQICGSIVEPHIRPTDMERLCNTPS